VALELFHSSKILPAERAACDDNFVLLVHERREVVLPDFCLKGAEKFGFLHAIVVLWLRRSEYIHMASDGFTDVFDTDTAKKSSDFSAAAAEFPPVQIKGLQRRAMAKVGGDLLAAKSIHISKPRSPALTVSTHRETPSPQSGPLEQAL
jgi:hypothetical protein